MQVLSVSSCEYKSDRIDLELRMIFGLKEAPVNSHDGCYLSKLILIQLLACYFLQF